MTNARKSFVFSKRDSRISTELGHDTAPPTRRCAKSCRSCCAKDKMTRLRCVGAPQPAAAAMLVIALDTLLYVCLLSSATTTPIDIYNGCGCFVKVLAVSHFGGFNHCEIDSDSTLIKCAGHDMLWFSNVCHHNDDDNNGESFKYGMEGTGHTQFIDVSSRDLLKHIARFRE